MRKSDRINWRENTCSGYKSYAKVNEKDSDGIACCRHNADNNLEMLFICKRYTYAFRLFAHGNYDSNDNAKIIAQLNMMTVDEKLILLSLNFTNIWFHIYLNNTFRNMAYFVAKNKFESTFVIDTGIRLRNLIAKSTNITRIWEIPKGKKKNKNESSLSCAVREFYEETRIPKKSYKIFPNASRTYSYIDEGVKYVNKYYFAYTRYHFEPKVDFTANEQLEEIADIRWMTFDQIKCVDPTGRLATFVQPIFNYMRKYVRR